MSAAETLLDVRDLSVVFRGERTVTAVDGVSFTI
ncbi:MAG: ABC transporter ATP-binding protein, partial [Pseudomonadota bacterium]|nr:ABC transporter ATP-binding protein [Pseudomonadota bacterium]